MPGRSEAMGLASICQPGHEAARSGAKFIDGSGGRDVKRAIIPVSPGEICRLFRQDKGSKMMTLRIPDPDAFGADDKEVPLRVHSHPVRHSIVGLALLFAKDASVCELHP